MGLRVFVKKEDLEVQDPEVYNFGVYLSTVQSTWSDIEEENDDSAPKNKDGEPMEYPWDDFEYVIIPDTDNDIKDAEQMGNALGASFRFDIEDMDRVFFVVKY